MSKRDPSKRIRSLHDLQLAKERSRYDILAREQALTSATRQLSHSFRSMLRASLYHAGQVAAMTAVQRLIASRIERKRSDK